MNRRNLWPAAVALTAAGLIAHEGHAPLPTRGVVVDRAKGQLTLSAAARTALDVAVGELGRTIPPETVTAPATLVAPWRRHAFVASRLSGRVVAMHVRPGQAVALGELLAEVQSQELELLQLELLTQRNEVRQAERVLAGLEASADAVPGQQLLDAQSQLQQNRNALTVATAKWRALGLPELSIDRPVTEVPALPITSPVAGTVIHADLAVGKVVEPGEHLFEVVDLSRVWAKIGILEKDLARVAVGQPVELRFPAYPGEAFSATVHLVALELDSITHLTTVWADLTNASKPRLLPGLVGQARIVLPTAAAKMKSIPPTALIDDGVDRFVLVETASATGSSEYQRWSVAVVRETPAAVEVRSAELLPGDRVVTRGSHELGGYFAPEILRLSPETARSLDLIVEPAGLHSVDEIVELPGEIDLPPERRSVAAAHLPGTLVSVGVDRDERVLAGAALGELFSIELINLQLDLLREHLAAELAQQQLERVRRAGSAVPRRKVVELEAAEASSRTRRDSVRRRLTLVGLTDAQLSALVARQELTPTVPVRASSAGAVVAFDKVLGQAVRADEPLFEIHDTTRPWVQGFVGERELSRIRVGQPARVRLTSDPSTALTGRVVRSGQTFGAQRTLSVWVELDADPPTPLRHHQSARLSLVVAERPAVLALPHAGVVRDGANAYVFIRQPDGLFARRAVELGRSDDRMIEITAGLTAGEPVAVTAACELLTAHASVK